MDAARETGDDAVPAEPASASEGSDADDIDESDDDDADEEDDDERSGDGDEARRPSRREEALTNEGEIAADYLEELLDIADLDGDIDTYIEGGRAHVSIITESDVLVGKNGKTLEALQELARLAVMTEIGHRSRLMLDIAGHREKRRVELQDLAADAIDEVKDSGEAVRLSPMNPFERKIVHDAIAAAGLSSESEGEEPNRRVVVMPASR
ncbi:Jag family protein [Nigerium massiliense]|uniref:Jag family protein n=1 Tax=Nigerium massiliense TaxID=1522317 RepID=UPI0036F23067